MTMLNEININSETANKPKGEELVGWGPFDKPVEEKKNVKNERKTILHF